MTKPIVSYRRIDQLKAIAFACGFTNEDARQFGKLSKTATWEALLEFYLVDGESPDTVFDDLGSDAFLDLDAAGAPGAVNTQDNHTESLDTVLETDTGTVSDGLTLPNCLYSAKPLDTVLEGETVASSRKQSDCLYTLTESPDTVLEGETVASSRKQSDCLYTLTESPDTSGWINDGLSPVCSFTPQNSINFLDWVDFAQLIAFLLASAGVFVLAMNLWQQINPLNLLPPVKVNIQIGTKL